MAMGSGVRLTGAVPTALGGAVGGGSSLKGVGEGGLTAQATHGCCHAPVEVQRTKAGRAVLYVQVAEEATGPAAKVTTQAQASQGGCRALGQEL